MQVTYAPRLLNKSFKILLVFHVCVPHHAGEADMIGASVIAVAAFCWTNYFFVVKIAIVIVK